MSNDVGVNMLGEVEANRKPARAGPLRVVIGNTRNSREVRKPDGHRSGATLQMRRPRQRSGFGGGRKRAFQQDALRMRGSESRMNPTISPVEPSMVSRLKAKIFSSVVRGMARSSIQ